jgi:hypothetical protein
MSSRRDDVLPSRGQETRALLPSLASLDVGTGVVVPLSSVKEYIHVACSYNDVATTKRLLQQGADVNERNAIEHTPLHHVSWKGNVECARLLLEYGADVNPTDRYDWTPLHEACYHGHADCVALLLASGASVAMMTTSLETPLDLAERAFRSWTHDTAECQRLVRRATRERYGKQLVAGRRHPLLDWEETTPLDFDLHRTVERAAVESALRALLLAEARRAGCALGEDAVTAVLRAVAS